MTNITRAQYEALAAKQTAEAITGQPDAELDRLQERLRDSHTVAAVCDFDVLVRHPQLRSNEDWCQPAAAMDAYAAITALVSRNTQTPME